jgi:hypothetical protein
VGRAPLGGGGRKRGEIILFTKSKKNTQVKFEKSKYYEMVFQVKLGYLCSIYNILYVFSGGGGGVKKIKMLWGGRKGLN